MLNKKLVAQQSMYLYPWFFVDFWKCLVQIDHREDMNVGVPLKSKRQFIRSFRQMTFILMYMVQKYCADCIVERFYTKSGVKLSVKPTPVLSPFQATLDKMRCASSKKQKHQIAFIIRRLLWAENETRTRDPNLGKVMLYLPKGFAFRLLPNWAISFCVFGNACQNAGSAVGVNKGVIK